jgi:hypothetical protein
MNITLKSFFDKLSMPSSVIEIGTINHVEKTIKYGEKFDFGRYIKDNQNKDIYFLANVSEHRADAGRAKDADIHEKKYIYLDFDIRKEAGLTDDDAGDERLMEIANEILAALSQHKTFKTYFGAVFTGNGIHVYYLSPPLAIDPAVYKAGLKKLVEEVNDISPCKADYACTNPARLARIPTSTNNKGSRKKLGTFLKPWNGTTDSPLLAEVLEKGGRKVAQQEKDFAKREEVLRDKHKGNSLFEAIHETPIQSVVARIMDWEVTVDQKRWRAKGEQKTKACYVHKDGNFVCSGGTDHFPEGTYSPFSFVKKKLGLSDKKVFKWFIENYPEVNKNPDGTPRSDSELLGDDVGRQKAVEIVDLILENSEIKLFLDERGEAYMAVQGDGSKIVKLDSQAFEDWVQHETYKKSKKVYGTDTVTTAAKILTQEARSLNMIQSLAVRVSSDVAGTYWYDLGAKAVKISANGYEVVDSPPITFRRFKSQRGQVEPETGGMLSDFLALTNLASQDDKVLLQVFLVSCFLGGFPHPILLLHGPHGSAKSTLFRYLKELIDPSAVQTLPPVKDCTQLIQIVSHHWASFFDNLSHLNVELSDAICRICTGGGFSKRKLYTDDDDVTYNLQHVIGINGINNVASKPDLLDRSLIIELTRIQPGDRKSEKELDERFRNLKPKLLGACFEAASKALAVKPTIVLPDLHRMADFTVWGYAIAEALGIGGKMFLAAYERNIGKQHDQALDSSAIGRPIVKLVREESSQIVEGTPTEILKQLNDAAVDAGIDVGRIKGWPKTASWLTRQLKELMPTLEAAGIQLAESKGVERKITLSVLKGASGEKQAGDTGEDTSLDAIDAIDGI